MGREEVSNCRTWGKVKDNVAKQLKQQLDEERAKHTETKEKLTAKNKTLSLTGPIIDRLSKRIIDCNTAVNETTGNLTSLTDASQRGTGNLKAAIWQIAVSQSKLADANTKLAEAKSKLANTTTNINSLKGGIQRGKLNVATAAKKLDLPTSKKDLEELRKLMMPVMPQSV